MKEGDRKIRKEDKDGLCRILSSMGCLPSAQGKVILNISPEKTISSIEVNVTFR